MILNVQRNRMPSDILNTSFSHFGQSMDFSTIPNFASLAASHLDAKELIHYASTQRDNFNLQFTTVIYATLALSYQFSRPKKAFAKSSLYFAWIALFLAGLAAGARLYSSAEVAKSQAEVTITLREYWRIVNDTEISDDELSKQTEKAKFHMNRLEALLSRSAKSFKVVSESNTIDSNLFLIQCVLFVGGMGLLGLSAYHEEKIESIPSPPSPKRHGRRDMVRKKSRRISSL
jgi:hypothetical protein